MLLWSGAFPFAYAYPVGMRSTRDLLAHVANTNSWANLSAMALGGRRRAAAPHVLG